MDEKLIGIMILVGWLAFMIWLFMDDIKKILDITFEKKLFLGSLIVTILSFVILYFFWKEIGEWAVSLLGLGFISTYMTFVSFLGVINEKQSKRQEKVKKLMDNYLDEHNKKE